MTPKRFNECLKQIDWSLETLAENLGCDESLTTAYSVGTEQVPLKIVSWLEALAQARGASSDPLVAILGPIVDVTTDASEEVHRELLADVARRASIGRIERENAIMKKAIQRSQHYLRLALLPDGLSAVECITGLLQTLDNDEINEVTKRHE